jgi:rhodanese-related sulfurtransferase
MLPTAAMADFDRLPAREDPMMVPERSDEGLARVDATWGTVQPLQLGPAVQTVGELEVIEHIQRGLPTVDTRLAKFHGERTIRGARPIPHEEILERRHELNPDVKTVFFCNGPQCTATPEAIHTLLESGYPADAILYYRGGMHDWITLGYPTASGDS